MEDITELRQAEETLREEQHFLASIFASVQDGITILNKELQIERVNLTTEKWYTHAMPLVGKRCYEAYHGRDKPCEVCPSRQTLETGKAAYKDDIRRGADGEIIRWLELYTFPFVDIATGQSKGVIEYVRDITERRRAEEALVVSDMRYRLLAQNAIDVIWTVNINLDSVTDDISITDDIRQFTYFSPSVTRLLGYSADEAIGYHMEELLTPSSFDAAKKAIAKALEREESEQEDHHVQEVVELEMKHKDGSTVWMETSLSLLRNQQGRPIALMGVTRDISERRAVEEARLEMEADCMKSEFISNISHELRTPLQSIKGFNKLMLEGKVPDPELQKEFLTITVSQSEQLDRLVSNLLDVARLESSRFSIQKRSTSVANIIREAVESFYTMANDKDIVINEDIPATLPEMEVDRERLGQVLSNLLSNAVKFSSKGGKIMVTAEVKDHDLLVQVTDCGIGIPEDAIPRVFEKFYQLQNPTNGAGTGLGLYISKQIIEAHGGSIWVESQVGEGSTFSFILPLGAALAECTL